MVDSNNSGDTNPPSYKTNSSNPAPSYRSTPFSGYRTGINERALENLDTTSANNQLTGQKNLPKKGDLSSNSNNSCSAPCNTNCLQRSTGTNDLVSLIRSSELVNSNTSCFPEGSREDNTPLPNSYSDSYIGKNY